VANIDSLKDPLIQTARALGTRSGRAAAGRALADGTRLVTQIIDAGGGVEAVLVPAGHVDEAFAERAAAAGVAVHSVRPGVLRHISGSAVAPDCLAIVTLRPEQTTTPPGHLTIVCDRVADPGNLGSIIRTARGLGCRSVVIAGDADTGSRRVIEASRGAVLRTGVHRFADGRSAVGTLRADGWLVVATDSRGDRHIEDVDVVPGGRVAVVVGNETDGLGTDVRRAADVVAAIDLDGAVESLNVAVAAGIALYALRRRLPTS
jgi:TrmH family RNA methyltransferase